MNWCLLRSQVNATGTVGPAINFGNFSVYRPIHKIYFQVVKTLWLNWVVRLKRNSYILSSILDGGEFEKALFWPLLDPCTFYGLGLRRNRFSLGNLFFRRLVTKRDRWIRTLLSNGSLLAAFIELDLSILSNVSITTGESSIYIQTRSVQ